MARDFFDIRGRRERQREYNRSEAGKARRKKWRQSPRGKAKLRENYRRRKESLDDIKAKIGCLSCGESNPRVLRFWPRDPQKIKFLPALKNSSRSMKDWLGIIKACDVFCLNCLAKKKPRWKSGRGPRRTREEPEMSRQPIVNDGRNVYSVLLWPNTSNHTCKTCGAEFKSKSGPRKREFCSDRCRLLSWAAKEILKAHYAGQAEGLRGIITRLAEVKG